MLIKIGEFSCDNIEGFGVYSDADGLYIGDFQGAQHHGKGKFIHGAANDATEL